MESCGCQNVFKYTALLLKWLILPSFTKESEEYPNRIAGLKHEVDGDFRRLQATFDNCGIYLSIRLQPSAVYGQEFCKS